MVAFVISFLQRLSNLDKFIFPVAVVSSNHFSTPLKVIVSTVNVGWSNCSQVGGCEVDG